MFKPLRACRAVVVAALAILGAGCSIHPLPDDLSKATTYDIVARVRCEVREALLEFKHLPDEKDRRHAQNIIKLSAIGFDFIFDIAERNNIKSAEAGKPGAALKYKRQSFKDKDKGFSLDFSATTERERENTRRFRVVEDLKDLNSVDPSCSQQARHANLIYPVVGATGMGEVVKTYVRLEMLTDLAKQDGAAIPGDFEDVDEKTFAIAGKSIAFSDALQFRTVFTAGANPRLTLRTIAGDLRLTDASLIGSAQREDIHTVIVALASGNKDLDDLPPEPRYDRIPVEKRAAAKRNYDRQVRTFAATRATREVNTRTMLAFKALSRDSRTATALVQSQATARTNVLIELERLRGLEEDEREEPRRLGDRLLKLLREPD